jgi:ADP-heptose:LPS heptosyltransferase
MQSGAKKVLILRLSSLGDLILASSVLEAPALRNAKVDWLLAQEFETILKGHPQLDRVLCFDRRTGFFAWIRLCWSLTAHSYSEVWDLHSSLRSKILRLIFWIASMIGQSSPSFRVLKKERLRYLGYFVFKNLWPLKWRPRPWLDLFSELAGVKVRLRPQLNFLASEGSAPLHKKLEKLAPDFLTSQLMTRFLGHRKLLAVMPSSTWKTKEWPIENWVKALKEGESLYFPVVLGTSKDQSSIELCRRLKTEQIPHLSLVGQLELNEVAALLEKVDAFVGVDTGLYHLAATLNVSSFVILGPTTEDCGYPAWASTGSSISTRLACQPCGKNGSRCHRIFRKQLCLTSLKSEAVLFALASEGKALHR